MLFRYKSKMGFVYSSLRTLLSHKMLSKIYIHKTKTILSFVRRHKMGTVRAKTNKHPTVAFNTEEVIFCHALGVFQLFDFQNFLPRQNTFSFSCSLGVSQKNHLLHNISSIYVCDHNSTDTKYLLYI